MSKSDIKYSVTINTKEFKKQLRKTKFRITIALLIIRFAQWIGHTKVNVEIKTEQEK